MEWGSRRRQLDGKLVAYCDEKLGESVEYTTAVNVLNIADGNNELSVEEKGGLPLDEHYTMVEISDHNREFHGRTISSIKQYLGSMYRQDFRDKILTLRWGDEALNWDLDDDKKFLKGAGPGDIYRRDFEFKIVTNEGLTRRAKGWVGILDSGSRARAGFSILYANRVIMGFPDSWRPRRLYGQIQGSNDLVNQRLFGEIHLDDFEVSHTKDQIIWSGNEEELVNDALWEKCSDYRGIAQQHRKAADDPRGPSPAAVDTAISQMKAELRSSHLQSWVSSDLLLTNETIQESRKTYVGSVVGKIPTTFKAQLADNLLVRGFVEEMSVNDPYLATDHPSMGRVDVIVNKSHPHWKQLSDAAGVFELLAPLRLRWHSGIQGSSAVN